MLLELAPHQSPSAEAPTPAASALAAVIEAGAKILVAQPWRAGRIIPHAEAMTFDELASAVGRRRAAAYADLNRAIAFAQLGRALASPCFRAAWDEWRSTMAQVETIPAPSSK